MNMLNVMGVTPKVLKILEGNPTLHYSSIANEVGVTRERVRQIAQRNGYAPRKGILKLEMCPLCGKTFKKRNRIYCSSTCAYKARHRRTVVNCFRCGKPIERRSGTMRNKTGRYYCSRSCYERKIEKKHFQS